MVRAALNLLRLDALNLDVRLFSCSDGKIGAEAPGAMVRSAHTLDSLTAYGDCADEAVCRLWEEIENIAAEDYVRVKRGSELRYYRWNGAAWKETAAHDAGLPAKTAEPDPEDGTAESLSRSGRTK
jgi:hypothetical protein